MGELLCFTCRTPFDEGVGLCPRCASRRGATAEDPPPMQWERTFLIEAGLELTVRGSTPTFLGYAPEVLEERFFREPEDFLGLLLVTPSPCPDLRKTLLLLGTGVPRERTWAALQLGRDKPGRYILPLLRALSDPDGDVRAAVLWALGKTRHPVVVPPLLEYHRKEKEKQARIQLAATLYQLLVAQLASRVSNQQDHQGEIQEVSAALEDEGWESDLLIRRGKAYMKAGFLLHAIGDFTRSINLNVENSPLAYLHRSQAFLFMGRPLFALDDLLCCPEDFAYPPTYFFHRTSLMALADQIMSKARKKGLEPYAQLFQRRLDRLQAEEPTNPS